MMLSLVACELVQACHALNELLEVVHSLMIPSLGNTRLVYELQGWSHAPAVSVVVIPMMICSLESRRMHTGEGFP
jgi:hypothetical protein